MNSYRADIDGLRALAVLAVIGFHAAPGFFPGGYVGVDIFFVISGYLITSIIARELQQNRFTFAHFYARRCKRIFPALILTLGFVLTFGWLFLLSDEFRHLGKHVAAGAAFIANFASWLESGYFDKAAATKPLLHLWSLGIEEQFYLLWPPLLVWTWKSRKWNALSVAIGTIAISFALNIILVSLWQADMYYLPFVRFWELVLGAALGLAYLFEKDKLDHLLKRARAFTPNIQSTVGLLLILLAIIMLDDRVAFPGYWALLPTLGTLLMISAGPDAWINRQIFSRRAIVYVGLISYPLYLWHWPLLSYAHIIEGGTPAASARWFAVVLAFVFASLTYHLFEKPVRSSANRNAVVLAAAMTVVVGLGLATFTHQVRARSERYGFDNIVKAAAGKWGFPSPELKPVHTALGYHFERGDGQKVLFVGDSHMQQYYPGIDRVMNEHPETSKGVVFVTQLNCAPIPNIDGITLPGCRDLMENALSMAQRKDVDTIVIAGAWNRYTRLFEATARERTVQSFTGAVLRFHEMGKQVVIILPIPRGELFDPAHLVNRSLRDFGFTLRKRVEQTVAQTSREPAASMLTQVARTTGAELIDPINLLCNPEYCPTFSDDGLPVYTDDSHLRPAYVRQHIHFLDDVVLASEKRKQ